VQSLANPDYGEGKAYKQLQQDAPMAASSGMPAGGGGGMDLQAMLGGAAAQNVVPMGADSTQPGTPVTDGAAMGAGSGTGVMGFRPPASQQDLQNLAAQLPVLEWMANQPGASWSLRNLVRNIKAQL
jgi:hypothetical protein